MQWHVPSGHTVTMAGEYCLVDKVDGEVYFSYFYRRRPGGWWNEYPREIFGEYESELMHMKDVMSYEPMAGRSGISDELELLYNKYLEAVMTEDSLR